MQKPDLVQLEALESFTVTTHYGQFHGDPDNHSDKARFPLVPAHAVDDLVARGKARHMKAKAAPMRAAPAKAAERAPAETKSPSELSIARAEYKAVVGKGPNPRLDVAGVRKALEDFKANGGAAAAPKAPAKRSRKPKAAAKPKSAPKITSDAPID